MTRLGAGLALTAGLLLSACSDEGGVPIYLGGEVLTTVGGPAPAAVTEGTVNAAPRRGGFGLGSIFASEGTPVYVGGRRINCPEGQPDC